MHQQGRDSLLGSEERGIDPIELLQEPNYRYKSFYDKHRDLMLKILAAGLYLAAAGLLLFPVVAPLAVAFGLAICGGVASFLAALADYHRYNAKHQARIESLEAGLDEFINAKSKKAIRKKIDNAKDLSYWRINLPTVSLVLAAASTFFLNIIAILNLAGALSGASILAAPYVLVGIVALNLVFLILKDLVISKMIQVKTEQINTVAVEISSSLKKARQNQLNKHLPKEIKSYADGPLPKLKVAVRAYSRVTHPSAGGFAEHEMSDSDKESERSGPLSS